MAPASDFEKLEIAIHFGADAVYVAAKNFSLRNFSGNFSFNQLQRAVALVHTYDVKLYLACNIYSRNSEQDAIADFLKSIGTIQPDAVIIADPDNYHTRTIWKAELENINYRGYRTGFYFIRTEQLTPNFNMQKPEHKHIFVGKVITQPSPRDTRTEVRHKIYRDEDIEILRPVGPVLKDQILDIVDDHHQSMAIAQPGSRVTLKLNHYCSPNDLIRRVSTAN